MRFRKTLIALGLAGVVAVAAIAGTAFAQTPTPTPNQNKTNYQNVFMDKLAAALGKSRDELNAAFTQARNGTVDQEVTDGKLTQAQADAIKARQGNAPFGGFGAKGGDRGEMRGGGFFMGGADVQDAIAKALVMTTADMKTQLQSGKTLAVLAQGKEQAVKDAIVSVEKPKLDQSVKDGKLTQDRENQIIDGIQKSDLSKMGGHWGMGRGNGNAPKSHSQNEAPRS